MPRAKPLWFLPIPSTTQMTTPRIRKPNAPRPHVADYPPLIVDINARAEYMRITKLLGDKVNKFDLSLLIDYCITHGEIIKLRSVCTNEGEVLVGPKGGTYINPRTNILLSKISHLSSLRRDLFFTPKSRADKVGKPNKAKSMLASLDK